MRRLLVTGREGQIVRALRAQSGGDLDVIALGRPELDLAHPSALAQLVERLRPDLVVNAAAYTNVDGAEAEESLAASINGEGAGALAQAAARIGAPIIQISTEHVFDGSQARPYVEGDPVSPVNAYGRSKLAGERAVAAAHPRHAILRTSWVYDGAGRNFLRAMLALAERHESLKVVSDQIGAPTYAPDFAAAVLRIARNILDDPSPERFGVFHLTASGATDRAGFARDIFRLSAASGGPSARVLPVLSEDFPTPARRPKNSRLCCDRIAAVHGVRLPDWRDALERCMAGLARESGR